MSNTKKNDFSSSQLSLKKNTPSLASIPHKGIGVFTSSNNSLLNGLFLLDQVKYIENQLKTIFPENKEEITQLKVFKYELICKYNQIFYSPINSISEQIFLFKQYKYPLNIGYKDQNGEVKRTLRMVSARAIEKGQEAIIQEIITEDKNKKHRKNALYFNDPNQITDIYTYYVDFHRDKKKNTFVRKTNIEFIKAFVVDVENISVEQRLLIQEKWEDETILKPTSIVESGNGVHILYSLKPPAPYHSWNKVNQKYIENIHSKLQRSYEIIPNIDVDHVGICQSYRFVGTKTKFGSKVQGFIIGDKYSIEEIADFFQISKINLKQNYIGYKKDKKNGVEYIFNKIDAEKQIEYAKTISPEFAKAEEKRAEIQKLVESDNIFVGVKGRKNNINITNVDTNKYKIGDPRYLKRFEKYVSIYRNISAGKRHKFLCICANLGFWCGCNKDDVKIILLNIKNHFNAQTNNRIISTQEVEDIINFMWNPENNVKPIRKSVIKEMLGDIPADEQEEKRRIKRELKQRKWEDIRNKLLQGETINKIIKEYKISLVSLYRNIEKDILLINRIKNYYENMGLPIRKIIKLLKVDSKKLYNLLKKHNIKLEKNKKTKVLIEKIKTEIKQKKETSLENIIDNENNIENKETKEPEHEVPKHKPPVKEKSFDDLIMLDDDFEEEELIKLL